ncbi:MAG: DEAD/DEAH box helicase, partial [Bacteroidota bacterium]
PLALYGENEVTVSNRADAFYFNDKEGGIGEIKRDVEKEKSFYNFVVGLHPKFNELNQQEFFYLNCNEIMEGLWFLNFFEQCKNQGVEVYGFENLKNIKYNPHKPTTNYHVESGIDWFDVKMDVKFGDQKVSLKEIRKSILNKQKAVKLDDGSTGILPEEWINKWLTALKFGKLEEDDTLKLSNLHFLLIEDLYKQLDDNAHRKEIHEKKKKLNDFKELKQVTPPEGLKATLRHYQEEGLNWLNFLCEFGWGGCLADDMGLGKTIQVLALILHIKQKDKRKKHVSLVVAPTTLLFNWQAEIEKFCPGLRAYLHWGQGRDTQTKNWKKYDLILTTYGTLTNDIEFIRKFHFNLTILDESQAIKNPSSLRFKAVRLLSANTRLSLTGTPIENNTLELFAQMQYLNPGYLGSLHFFKKEFSNAIDKQKDKNQAYQLSKMIRPFILRRKKEDVAKELPEKTETTMFCEMEEHQRKVYEHFKDDIRQQLLSKIDEEGMEKARFNILEGLLKLRQICDSPALLNTKEDYGNDSVKAEELVRHIRNKTGKHKILVFSQFIGMLQLIKNKLDQEKIKYAYLDGQTKNRQAEVHTFQNTRTCRVFLLSIKAGGLGLNLTKADYVYIIDPWWNPAVEAQAIDRTHRIGQEKHVFAYKMVCKDTIEEKIVQLQQKKQEIADDLISTDKGFVSNLSRGDIEELLA